MKRVLAIVLLVAAAGALGWYLWRDELPGIGRQGATSVRIAPDAPLAFVPADSPYVFGNLEALPADVMERWYLQFEGMGEIYAMQFAQAREAMLASGDADPQALALFDALREEFAGKSLREWNASLGFGEDVKVALYGLGVVPVLRIELADPARFRALVERLQAAAGQPLPEAELDGQRYWTLAPPEAPLTGVVAIVDHHLVASMLPAQPDAAVVRQILGLDRPAQSIADSGALQALSQEFGYTPYFTGFIDAGKLLAAVTGPATALETVFLERLGIAKPALDDVCRTEWQALAASWPRLVLGYTRFDADGLDMHAALQARSDIATELMKLRAPMPGLQAVGEQALLHIGVALRIGAVPEVVGRFAEQVAAAPWTCEALVPMNEMFAKAQSEVANPAIYATAPVAYALHAVLNRIELADPSQPSIGGMLAIGSDNPQALLALARNFAPEIANLKLADDGTPKPLPAPAGVPLSDPIHVAMNRRALGLSIGAGEEAGLAPFLAVDEREQPLIAGGMSAAGTRMFGEQVGKMMREQAAAAPPEQREKLQREADMMQAMYAKGMGASRFRLELTARGVEMTQSMDWN